GKATLSTTALTTSAHSITAAFGGSCFYTPSTSGALSQTVNKAGTTTELTSSLIPSRHCQSATFTATVAAVAPGAGTPTGTVTFKDGSTALGTASLSAGKATFATSALTTAGHSITATYNGSGDFTASTSAALTQTVNKANTTTKVTSSL